MTTDQTPAQADVLVRVRGVDKIYRGMLRFGRPEPDYRRTDGQNVVLRLATVVLVAGAETARL